MLMRLSSLGDSHQLPFSMSGDHVMLIWSSAVAVLESVPVNLLESNIACGLSQAPCSLHWPCYFLGLAGQADYSPHISIVQLRGNKGRLVDVLSLGVGGQEWMGF